MTEPEFQFVGGALCLDFMNTVGGRIGAEVLRDKLRRPQDLSRWAGLAGIAPTVGGSRRLVPIRRTLTRALTLREALYRICDSLIEGRSPRAADMTVLNKELSKGRSRERLRYARRAFHIDFEDARDRVLWAVARSAAELFTSADFTRLRRCGGSDCGWIFLDSSRNRSRRWCEMRVCGNRAKARNFRQRQGQ